MKDTTRWDLDALLRRQFEIDGELRDGGLSRSFVATEIATGRRVVIPVLFPVVAATIDHPRFSAAIARAKNTSTVPVLASGESGELPYFIRPYVDGESLRHRMDGGPLPTAGIIALVRDLAGIVASLHRQGALRCRLRPDNVVSTAAGMILVDPGVAAALAASWRAGSTATEADLVRATESITTAEYLAPEIAGSAAADARADIYALGSIAYAMLAGHPPFPGSRAAPILDAHLHAMPRPIAEVRDEIPAALNDVVMACLAREPGARPSAGAVLQVLDGMVA